MMISIGLLSQNGNKILCLGNNIVKSLMSGEINVYDINITDGAKSSQYI